MADIVFCILVVGYLALFFLTYPNDSVRDRMAEGLFLANDAKNLVVDNAVNDRPYDHGWQWLNSTNNTKSVEIDRATGVITIVGTDLANNIVLLLTPSVGGVPLNGQKIENRIKWICSEPTGKVAPHYLPSECR